MDLKRNIVENTNDCSIVSKYSMSIKGYAFDEYLKYFICDQKLKRSRSPLINRGYYVRHKAIEYAFNRCDQLNQIISIGCGFDTSSLRFPNIDFIEIDFPFVAKTKANILLKNQLIKANETHLGINAINNENNEPLIILRTDNYCLIGADLRKYDLIEEFFIKHNLLKTVKRDTRIGLLNECSLCYLKQSIADNIIKAFYNLYNKKCYSITYIGYEMLNSNQTNDGFSSVMLNHFKTIGSPLMTFLTKSQLINRFQKLNFDFVDVLDMKSFYDNYIDVKEKQRIDSLEMFDEFEEFDLLCNCYALTIAITNYRPIDSDLNPSLCELRLRDTKPINKTSSDWPLDWPLVYRFGHTSCVTKNNKIVLFGGFGCDSDVRQQNNIHKRVSNLIEINTETNQLMNYSIYGKTKTNTSQRIHSKTVELEDNLFLISGGRQSPSIVLNNELIKLMPENKYEMQSITECGNIPPNVFRHLFIKLTETNKMVQFGGKQSIIGSHKYQDNCYHVLDTNTMQWQQKLVNNEIYSKIHSHSGTSLNSNVFIINGGLTCDTNSFASNDIYLMDDRIQTVNGIQVKGLDHLYSHNIKNLSENKVLIIGGIGKSGANNKIHLFDLRSNNITDSMTITTNSSLMLHNFSSELIMTNERPILWIIGGGGNCFSFGTHFNDLSVVDIFSK